MDIYKGYKILTGSSDVINQEMNNINYSDWNINEYFLIRNTDDGSEHEMRFNGFDFVPLKLPPSKFVKAKNALQRCALDALCNPDITIVAVLGTYGSGKSYLTARMALYHVNEKGNQSFIECIREYCGDGRQLGFLPGELDNKIYQFTLPFSQQLDGGEFEMESLRHRGVLNATTPFFLKGQTFNNTVLWVDEAEDLTESQLRLVGTRVGENSQIFISGDIGQSIYRNAETNPLLRMCDELKGNREFACIYLDEDIRSKTSRLFADLFRKD